MTDLTVNLTPELAKHDFLDRPLYVNEPLNCLGDYLYRPADAAEFLLFLHYLCQNQRQAAAILRGLGAKQLQVSLDELTT